METATLMLTLLLRLYMQLEELGEVNEQQGRKWFERKVENVPEDRMLAKIFTLKELRRYFMTLDKALEVNSNRSIAIHLDTKLLTPYPKLLLTYFLQRSELHEVGSNHSLSSSHDSTNVKL